MDFSIGVGMLGLAMLVPCVATIIPGKLVSALCKKFDPIEESDIRHV